MLTIAGYSDPYELWAAACSAPKPTPCQSLTKKGEKCSFLAQNNLVFCKKHWQMAHPGAQYPMPDFFVSAVTPSPQVLHGGEYIHLAEAVVMLKIQEEIPVGLVLHHINSADGDYPDNIQLVPASVSEEAKKLLHPKGEPIRWKEENGVLKYNPTSVRLPAELIDFLDAESERLQWSRNKVLEFYLMRGIESGSRPETLEQVLGEVLLSHPKSVGVRDLFPAVPVETPPTEEPKAKRGPGRPRKVNPQPT